MPLRKFLSGALSLILILGFLQPSFSQTSLIQSNLKPKKFKAVAPEWKGQTVGGVPMASVREWALTTRQGPAGITEKFDISGKLRERTVTFADRSQSEYDYDGDGRLDAWSLMSNELEVRLHSPQKGKFSVMEVVRNSDQDSTSMTFFRTKDGDFRLFARATQKIGKLYRVESLPDDVAVGECVRTDERFENELLVFNQKVKAGVFEDYDFDNWIQDKILDPSCKGAGVGSAAQQEELKRAIKRVLTSNTDFTLKTTHAQWEEKRKRNRTESRGAFSEQSNHKGLFLACLRRYGLDPHATRIAAALQTQRFDNSFKWTVKCAAPKPHENTKCGSAHREEGQPIITMFMHPAGSTGEGVCHASAEKDKNNVSEMERTFFHEMLHYSGVKDERHTEAITDCCSGTDPKVAACQVVRDMVWDKFQEQQMEYAIFSSFEEGELQAMKQLCEDMYGVECGTKYKQMLSRKREAWAEVNQKNIECRDWKSRPERCNRLYEDASHKVVRSIYSAEDCVRLNSRRGFQGNSIDLDEIKKQCAYMESFAVRKLVPGAPPSSGESYCKGAQETLSSAIKELLDRLTVIPKAEAFSGRQFCEVASSVKGSANLSNPGAIWAKYRNSYADAPEAERRKAAEKEEALSKGNWVSSKDAKDTGSLTTISDSKPSKNLLGKLSEGGEPLPYEGGLEGPRLRKPFSDSTRQERIALVTKEIQKQNSFADRLEKYFEIPYEKMFPPAQASDAEHSRMAEARDLLMPDPLRDEFQTLPSVRSAGTGLRSSSDSQASAPRAIKTTQAEKSGKIRPEGRSIASEAPQGSAGAVAGRGPSVAGGSSSQARKPSSVSSQKSYPQDLRGRRVLVRRLLALDGDSLLRELEQDATQFLLARHRVVVIDPKGQQHGPIDNAAVWLVYRHDRDRLVQLEERQ